MKRFKSHEKSNQHINACTKNHLLNQGANVSKNLSKSKEKDMKSARIALIKVIETVFHKAIKGEALKGHDEQNSKLYRLLKLRSCDVPELNFWMNRTKYK